MKKTYINPKIITTNVRVKNMITASLIVDAGQQVNTNFGRQDNGWDIWGSDDEAE